jgi:SAM-dependent methyltransferase
MNVTERTTCRSCADARLASVLDLGNLAVSDFVTDPTASLDRAPLELVRCEGCGLVQLRHTVDRDRLYRNYWYRSGVSETMVAALRDVVEDARRRVDLKPADWVLDIGSNDGTLLKHYPPWVRPIGFEPSDIEPAPGQHKWAFTVRDFFPPTRYAVEPKPCKIVTAIACFYDLDDPGSFLEEVKRWLHPKGVLVLQFQDLGSMIRADAIDNVCHEHLTYWDEEALRVLLRRHGLAVVESTRVAINGGSLRFAVCHVGHAKGWYAAMVRAAPSDLAAFAERAQRNRIATVAYLQRLKAEGARVYGIAASTKFNTLSQYYGIGPDLIQAIGERFPAKVGKYTVTGIPIVSEEAMREARPDYLFCCAWQFSDAFAEREKALLEQGTKLIVPLPELRILEQPTPGDPSHDPADHQLRDAVPPGNRRLLLATGDSPSDPKNVGVR